MSSGTPIPPAQPGATKTTPSSGQVVQIVSLPDALKTNARGIRIEGEVIGQNKDGSTRIQTSQGDIDVVIRGRQLQPGTKVEVDIPAGNPPRNVTVRPAPPQTPPLTNPPTTSTPSTSTTIPVPDRPPSAPQPATPPSAGSSNAPPPEVSAPTQPVGTTKPSPPPAQQPIAGETQTTAIQAPRAPLPPLSVGTTITLIPVEDPVQTEITQPQLSNPSLPKTQNAAPLTPAVAPSLTKEGVATPAVRATGIVGTFFQTLKTALIPNVFTASNTDIKNTGLFPSTPSNVTAADKPIQLSSQQPVALLAKVLSITLPSGQFQTAIISSETNTTLLQGVAINTPAPSPLNLTVSAQTPLGQPVVSIPINTNGTTQNFVIQTPPAAAPIGTQISLQPLLASPPQNSSGTVAQVFAPSVPGAPAITLPATPIPVSSLPPAWRALIPLMQPSTLWPAMDDLFQSFYQATPQAAQILSRILPSPANPQNMGASMMLFAAALKSGDLEVWLGQKKLDMLQKIGKGDILSKIAGETNSLSGKTDAPATDWKSFPMPILWQNEISKVLFHVRKEPSEESSNDGQTGTRFLLDLSLTRMGDVQLDGLLRGKRLDLIVRTQMPVSLSMQDAMKKAYADALDGSDIYGELGFQGDLNGWVSVLEKNDAIRESI